MMDLKSSTAVVTGAGRGLGAAISQSLVEEGVKVYGIARSRSDLKILSDRLGSGFVGVPLDLTDKDAVKKWVDKEFDKSIPDILINNAGVGSFGKIDEMPDSELDSMIDVNLKGLFNITIPIVSKMKLGKTGYIINIGSILGTTTRSEGAAYSATKYGIRGFSESLMKELRVFSIKVSCLHPGSIDTHFFESSGIEPHSNMLQPEDLSDVVLFLLKTPKNLLIDELIVRPLDSRNPNN